MRVTAVAGPSRSASLSALPALALALLLPALAAAQQRAVHATGTKHSIGTLDIEVLHAPESCRVQAFHGDTVVVDYVGTFAVSGREFDSSKKHKSGFSFELGKLERPSLSTQDPYPGVFSPVLCGPKRKHHDVAGTSHAYSAFARIR
jgi:hypothetical protein